MTGSTSSRMGALLRPLRGRIALAVLAGAAAALSTAGLLAASGLLISRSALRPAVLDLMVLIGVVRLLALGRGTFRYLERIASHDAALRSLPRVRVWFYQRLEPLAPGGLRSRRSGDLLSRFAGDVDSLQSFVVRGIVPLGAGVVAALACLALAWVLLPAGAALLALLALVPGALVPWVACLAENDDEERTGEARGRLAADVADLMDGAAEIVGYGREQDWLGRLGRAEAALEAAERRVAWRTGLREGIGRLALGMAPLAVLVVGIPAVRSGRLPGVDLAALVLLGAATLDIVRTIPGAVDSLRSELRTAGRLFALADHPAPVRDPATPLRAPVLAPIAVEDLHVRYGPDLPLALDGVDLTVEPGRCLALVGPSGGGKTTLANTLLRFSGIESGSVRIAGDDIRAFAQADVRRLIGLLAQDAHIFNTTIGANIRLARPDASGAEVAEACRQAGLTRWLATLPQGLATPAGDDGALVSGGERQRIALARALLAGRDVLILDEPTSNLDPGTAAQVIGDLLPAAAGRSTVLITHDLAAASRADSIVVVDRGGSVEAGTHADLLALGGRYAGMWGKTRDLER